MTVLLIAEFGTSGGTRTFVKRLLSIHREQGIRTVVVTGNSCDAEMKAHITACGGQWRRNVSRPDFTLGSFIGNKRAFQRDVEEVKPDLVVCSAGSLRFFHTPYRSVGGRVSAAGNASTTGDTKTAGSASSAGTLYFLHTYPGKQRWRNRIHYIPLRFLVNSRCRLVTVSNFARQAMRRRWGVNETFVEVVPNGYNPDAVAGPEARDTAAGSPQRSEAETARQWGEKNDPAVDSLKADGAEPVRSGHRVLTVGHVVEYKNPHTWIAVARDVTGRNADAEFVWVGDGPLLEECRRAVADYPRIHFPGASTQLADWYGKSAVYFQPSRKESQGISVLDAMANGLPCVVSSRGGLPESVQEGVNGYLCDVDDTDDYSERIRSLLENDTLCSSMGARGREIARESFAPRIQSRKILELYETMMRNNRPRKDRLRNDKVPGSKPRKNP